MPYELRLPPDTQNEIRGFITSRYHNLSHQEEALAVIERELTKLSVNPALGRTIRGGPFETRPIYRFVVDVDGVKRHVRVVYKVLKPDNVLVVSGFSSVEL